MCLCISNRCVCICASLNETLTLPLSFCVSFACMHCLHLHKCTHIHNPTCGEIFRSHLGWHFRMLFQSSKLKARTSLLPRFSEKRRSRFELWALKELSKMPSHVGLAVFIHANIFKSKKDIHMYMYIHTYVYVNTHSIYAHTNSMACSTQSPHPWLLLQRVAVLLQCWSVLQHTTPLKVPIHDFCCNVLQCCCSAEVCCSTLLHSKSSSMTFSLSEWQLYVHTHIYIHVYICTHMCKLDIYMYIGIYAYIYVYTYVYIHMYVYAYMGWLQLVGSLKL